MTPAWHPPQPDTTKGVHKRSKRGDCKVKVKCQSAHGGQTRQKPPQFGSFLFLKSQKPVSSTVWHVFSLWGHCRVGPGTTVPGTGQVTYAQCLSSPTGDEAVTAPTAQVSCYHDISSVVTTCTALGAAPDFVSQSKADLHNGYSSCRPMLSSWEGGVAGRALAPAVTPVNVIAWNCYIPRQKPLPVEFRLWAYSQEIILCYPIGSGIIP